MTRQRPAPDCREVFFRQTYAIEDSGQVALEDYARALTRARAAETLEAEGHPPPVAGLHLCGLEAPPAPGLLADLEAFAHDLAGGGRGGGLGWS